MFAPVTRLANQRLLQIRRSLRPSAHLAVPTAASTSTSFSSASPGNNPAGPWEFNARDEEKEKKKKKEDEDEDDTPMRLFKINEMLDIGESRPVGTQNPNRYHPNRISGGSAGGSSWITGGSSGGSTTEGSAGGSSWITGGSTGESTTEGSAGGSGWITGGSTGGSTTLDDC